MTEGQGFLGDLNAALAIAFQDAEDRFELNRHGMVTIDFQDHGEVVLQAMAEQGTVLLSAAVCPVVADDAALMRRALEVNLFGVAPLGAFLAFDPATSVLTLCQSTGPQVSEPDGLSDCLAGFVASIAAVRSLLLAPPVQTDSAFLRPSDVSEIIISG